MANSRFYSSVAAVTALQVTAAPGDNSIQLASSAGFPGSFPFTLSLDYGSANEELVDVTAGGPSVFNVTRGRDGTPASSHNAGAVVRHVTSARDFTDSRTHEASATGVHGISGQFVDTLSVQTMANKTLTNPTINAATVAGTVSAVTATVNGGTFAGPTLNSPTVGGTVVGSPTFSGAVVYTGTAQFSTTAGVLFQRTVATNSAIRTSVTGDSVDRLSVDASGTLNWGPGNAAADTNLRRSGIAQASLTGSLTATGSVAAGTSVSGATGTFSGALTAASLALTAQPFTSFTPVWTADGATLSVNDGWYTKFGKIVFYRIYGVFSSAGSGVGGVKVNLPTTPDRTGGTTRQVVGTAYYESLDNPGAWSDVNCMGPVIIFAGDSGPTTATLRNYKGATLNSGQIHDPVPLPTTIITIEGFYREV